MGGREFFSSVPGRLFCTTGVVALAGPGWMAVRGPSPDDVSVMAVIIIACILGCCATVMLSVYRFTKVALGIAFFGPLVAGFYIAGLSLVSQMGAGLGWGLFAVALLPVATVIAAPLRPVEREGLGKARPAHARA